MYFVWSRIRINKCLCNFDAFYLQVKLVCILFGLEFVLTHIYVMLVPFVSGGIIIYFVWSSVRM